MPSSEGTVDVADAAVLVVVPVVASAAVAEAVLETVSVLVASSAVEVSTVFDSSCLVVGEASLGDPSVVVGPGLGSASCLTSRLVASTSRPRMGTGAANVPITKNRDRSIASSEDHRIVTD